MKQFLIIFSFLSFLTISCSTVDGMKVCYENKKVFKRNDIKVITEKCLSRNEKTSHLFITEIIVNENKKIGLYGFTFKNLINSGSVTYKILKFKDYFIIYSENNKQNEKALIDFENENRYLFTSEELKYLQHEFNKGTNLNFRVF